RTPGREIHRVHGIAVDGIGRDDVVIPRTHHPLLIAVGALPARAAVVRAEDAARGIFGRTFYVRVQPQRTRRRDRQADLSEWVFRQARVARDGAPAVAAIGRLPQAAIPRRK